MGGKWERWEEVNVKLSGEVGGLKCEIERLRRELKEEREEKEELRRENEGVREYSSKKDDRIRELVDELEGRGGEVE